MVQESIDILCAWVSKFPREAFISALLIHSRKRRRKRDIGHVRRRRSILQLTVTKSCRTVRVLQTSFSHPQFILSMLLFTTLTIQIRFTLYAKAVVS